MREKHVGKSGRFQEIGRQTSPVDLPKRRPVQRFPAVSTCCSTSSFWMRRWLILYVFSGSYQKKRPIQTFHQGIQKSKNWKVSNKSRWLVGVVQNAHMNAFGDQIFHEIPLILGALQTQDIYCIQWVRHARNGHLNQEVFVGGLGKNAAA